MIIAAPLLGAFSVLQTPREGELQSVAPMLDLFVRMPGASSDEVVQRISLPMERLLREAGGRTSSRSYSCLGVCRNLAIHCGAQVKPFTVRYTG